MDTKSSPDPRQMPLTVNFTLGEFLPGTAKIPEPWVLDNLYRLANRLQLLRDMLGRPVKITSGYRDEATNRQAGGARKSLHLSGMAADISVPGLSPRHLQLMLVNWSGGLGMYKTHTHLDIRPSRARWRG